MKNIIYLAIFLTLFLFLSTPSVFAAELCKLEIAGNDQMQFDKKLLTAPSSCKKVTVTLKHVGKLAKNIMGHNWVLVKSSDVDAVGPAGITAGMENNHVPKDDKRILAATKVVGPGESTSVEVDLTKLDKSGSYSFICTFPGHYALMKGTFKIS